MRGTGLSDPTLLVAALIDTGADGTFIDGTVIDKLGLKRSGAPFEVRLAAGSPQRWDAYDFRVIFNNDHEINVTGARLDSWAFPGTRCILGRNILDQGHFTYDGRGKAFTFEVD